MNISWNNVFSFKVVCTLKETGLLLPHAVLRQFPVNFLQTKLGDRSVKKKIITQPCKFIIQETLQCFAPRLLSLLGNYPPQNGINSPIKRSLPQLIRITANSFQ